MNRVYIIAEIGTGHGGSIQRADELIAAAAAAGADCAKFQTVFADEIVPENVGDVPLPGGSIPLFQRFRELERPAEFYAELAERCRHHNIDFLSTPFGIRSARLLQDIGASAIKIASPELNHLPLLQEVAGYQLPLILSSGVSRLEDIERALATIDRTRSSLLHEPAAPAAPAGPTDPASVGPTAPRETAAPHAAAISLLHCVTAYPAPAEDYNLRLLPLLRDLFGVAIGVSDHSLDPELVPSLATAMGARIIEKHITLSHSDDGLDDKIALEPSQFARMTAAVRTASAQTSEQTLAAARTTYGSQQVEAVLGSGRKQLAPSEQNSYGRTNRSVHARHDLPAGHRIEPHDFALLRTEKILQPGIPPQHAERICGARLTRTVAAGQGIRWEDLLTLS